MNDDATFLNIESAAHNSALGINALAEPTAASCAAGNYKKGRITLYGLALVIAQPRNSYRTGTDARTGKRWVNRMAAHYGYICGTKGNDGDEVDCFIGPYPKSDRAYVINQNIGGRFDEHKVMLCFPDEVSARRAYLDSYDRDWRGLASLVPVSISQLKWWLKHGDMHRALRPDDLPHEGLEAMTRKVYWNGDAQPHDGTLDHILYDIRRSDAGENLLMDAVTVQDIMEDSDGELSLDALVSPYARLERRMEILRGIMERTGDKVKPVAMQVTQPFKQRGVANVAAIFELSDGQTVSIYFHNPDTTPGKMAPTDEVISWKWLLNKKDITIVVAPERGVDLNVREVARRIMRLAEKNSAAFQRANAKRAERMQTIADLKTEITQLEGELKSAQNELDVAKLEWEEAQERAKAQTDIEPDKDDDGSLSSDRPLSDEERAAIVQPASNSHTTGVADPSEPESNEVVRNINGTPPIAAEIEPRRENQPSEFTAAAKSYEEYLQESEGNGFKAAKAFYKAELQDKIVKTVIGDVWMLGGKARKEIQYGAKGDDIKSALIPQVPVILKSGEYKGKSELYKNREDRYVAFHYFQKSLIIGNKEITADVSVGERDDGQFQYTAYSLSHSGRKEWAKKEALRTPRIPGREGFTTDSVNQLLQTPKFVSGKEDCGDDSASGEIETQTLDAVNNEDDDGWNIRILKVVDLKTGERLRELEDGGGEDETEDGQAAREQARREAEGKIQVIAKEKRIEAGKAELAALPDDAPLADVARAVFASRGINVGGGVPAIVQAIEANNADGVWDLLRNLDNKASAEIFERATGIKLAKTQRDRRPQIDAWAGITPQQRAEKEAAKDAAWLADERVRTVKRTFVALGRMNVRNEDNTVSSGHQYLLGMVAAGFDTAQSVKRGAALIYGLSNGKILSTVKNRTFSNFIKAAIAFGGLRQALELVGAVEPKAAEAQGDADKIAAVDSAYPFESATDGFKLWLHESLNKADHSPFVTAKAMDEAAKRHNAIVEWDKPAPALDDVGHSVASLQAGLVAVEKQAADSATGLEAEAAASIRKAIDALEDEDDSPSEEEIGGLFETETVAMDSTSESPIKALLASPRSFLGQQTLDAANNEPDCVGSIKRNGEIVGRIDIDADGKAMVYVGAAGDERVVLASGTRAMYSDDDAVLMVDALLTGRDKVPETSAFGEIFHGYTNQPEAAIDKIMTEKRGEVPDAFVHPELGNIAFVYGDERMGLRHIEVRRGVEWVQRIPDILRNGRVERDPKLPRAHIVQAGEPANLAVVRLDWDGTQKTWLVTAYPDEQGKWSGGDKTIGTAADELEPVQGNPSRPNPRGDDSAKSGGDKTSSTAADELEPVQGNPSRLNPQGDDSAQNPQKDAARTLFQSIIDGTVPDILAPELADEMEAAYLPVQGDPEIEALFERAANAYRDAMLAATVHIGE